MSGLEVKHFTHNGKRVPGVRSIVVDDVQWATARSVSLRGVWVIRTSDGREIGHMEPDGKKYLKMERINALLKEICDRLVVEGKLLPPPPDRAREKFQEEQRAAKQRTDREKLERAAPIMFEALEFIANHGLLGGPYHLQDQAKRKLRVALEKATA